MIRDYLELGGVEIVNHARLRAYLETVGSPLTSGPDELCACPTLTASVLDHAPYTTPDDPDSPAPWWDPDVPESEDFAGLLVLSVDGMDERPVRRTVTNAVAGGAALGPARVQPRTITVTGILLGATCCAVEYGLHWLGEALSGCTGSGCDGDCMTVYKCCPGDDDMDPEEFNARHRRSLRRVALVDGPRVIARSGEGCTVGECSTGADVLTVEFVLVAATPWEWTDTLPVMDVAAPSDDGELCVAWCLHDAGGDGCDGDCRLARCPDPTEACADPSCQPPAPPVPGQPDTCFCLPIATNSACYEMDLSGRPGWSTDVPMITVRAGSQDLRRLTISFYERRETYEGMSCEEIAALDRCEPHSVYTIGYIPAGGAVILDGQIGRALIECGGVCESAQTVFGQDGTPPSWAAFSCAEYCVCIEADALFPPADDALVSIGVSGRGY